MIIKRYLVNSMNEAMTRIRYELGKDAVIISQRKVRKPGFAGFFAKKQIEVTAAVDNNKKEESKKEDTNNFQDSLDAIRKLVEKQSDEKNQIQKEEVEKAAKTIEIEKKTEIVERSNIEEKLLQEFKEMKNLIADIKNPAANAEVATKSEIELQLEAQDLNKKNIKKIAEAVKNNEEEVDEQIKLMDVLKSQIRVSDSKMQGIVVLVGPTGVGKTTTIAKLAGRMALMEKKKVGLITVDTYRIGAVEQLRTYADIMNLPFKVVITTKEMEKAIKSMADCEIILVDTTGRSSKNTMQISELRSFVEKTNSDNINLVVSCTTKDRDLEAIIEGFKGLKYNNVIITKLDETSTYGSILNILESSKQPLNFVTTGQNVPDDIKKLTSEEVCKLVLGDETIC